MNEGERRALREDAAGVAKILADSRAEKLSPLGKGILRYRGDVVGDGAPFVYSTPEEMVADHAARRIRELGRGVVENTVAIGGELVRVKKALKHGRFLEWLGAEFAWSERHARDLMAVHERFRSANVADLEVIDISALYRLAWRSTPPEVRQAALDRAAAGERVTHADVKAMLDKPAEVPKPAGPVQITSTDYEVVAVDDADAGLAPGRAGGSSRPQAAEWTPAQLERRARAETGEAVLANTRTDHVLIAWAEAEGRLVRIDRATVWGNPYEMPGDGDRDQVCDGFELGYWPHKRSLHCRLSELEGGKVLACWCCPDRCHGETLLAALAERGECAA